MGKKTQRTKQRTVQRKQNSALSLSQQVRQLDTAAMLVSEEKWPEVIEEAQRLLKWPSFDPEIRLVILRFLATAYARTRDYQKSYEIFTDTLSINPHDAEIYYQRAIVGRNTGRMGQAVRDMEAAYELVKETDDVRLIRKVQKELKTYRKDALKAARKRGRNFTLDQLTEQEEAYLQAIALMYSGKWAEAENLFRHIIETAEKDFDPRPWGNLGYCLMQQERYDEAEQALKRALKIDRFYRLARNNLYALDAIKKAKR